MKKVSVAVPVAVRRGASQFRLRRDSTFAMHWELAKRRGFGVAVVAVPGNPGNCWASQFGGGACLSPHTPQALALALGERRRLLLRAAGSWVDDGAADKRRRAGRVYQGLGLRASRCCVFAHRLTSMFETAAKENRHRELHAAGSWGQGASLLRTRPAAAD